MSEYMSRNYIMINIVQASNSIIYNVFMQVVINDSVRDTISLKKSQPKSAGNNAPRNQIIGRVTFIIGKH